MTDITSAASPGTSGATLPKSGMDRFIDGIEMLAAIFVGLVAANIFLSVTLRELFRVQIPDADNFGKLLLGILIFWGIAATSYRGAHISVDLLWTAANPKWRRIIDVFATLVLLFVVTVQTITLFDKVYTTYNDNVLTYDLRLRRQMPSMSPIRNPIWGPI